MRNWKFDMTRLNQTLFFINMLIFFIGFAESKSLNPLNFNNYSIEYAILLCSCLLIHLISAFNNYYT